MVTYWLWGQFVVVRPSAMWMYQWDSGPWLNFTEQPSSSMTINWITKDLSPTELLWGEDLKSLSKVTGEKGKIHRIYLSNLKSNTKYYYQLKNFPNDSNIHHFTTAPDNSTVNSPVAFIVVGDTQNGGGFSQPDWAYPKLIDQIEHETFDLVLHTGDASDQGNDIKSWKEFLDQSHRICADHPLQIAIGNHDSGSNYLQDKTIKKYRDDGANFDYLLGYKYGRPVSERQITSYLGRYYALDYGCCQFIFVDTQNQLLAAPWSNQWKYLEQILSNTTKPWKIVVIHWPLFELRGPMDGMASYSYRSIRYVKYLLPLFEKFHVDLILTGHEHLFMHHEWSYTDSTSKTRTIHQFITGGAGNELRTNSPLTFNDVKLPGFHYYEDSSHYCKILIDPLTNIALIQAIRPDGSIVYETKVEKS